MMTGDPIELLLNEPDWQKLERLANQWRILYTGPENPRLDDEAPLVARGLPDDLATFLWRFRRDEPAGAAVIRGWGLDDAALGPTPQTFDPPDPTPASLGWGCYVAVIASQLGRPRPWPHIQKGRRVHYLVPTPGDEDDLSGTSSASTLALHTEDACRWLDRPTYLLLFCLRNDDKTPTTYSSLASAGVDPAAAEVLFQPRFTMTVEPDHQAALGPELQVPVLYGDPAKPRLAYDGEYLRGNDREAADALTHLNGRLQAAATNLVLAPGDVTIIANEYATHGRGPFDARYDGRDRWLLRTLVR
jgi:L-asparagine oxygenase